MPGELETTAGTGTRDLTRIPPRPRAPAEDGDSLVRRLGRRLLGNALPPPKRRAGAVLCWDELVDWLEEQGVRVDGIREGDVFRLCHPQAPSGPQSRAQVFIFANRLRAISGDPAFTVDLDRMRGSADEA